MIQQKLLLCDDLIGTDPEESLYEYGVARNSDTGETLLYNEDLEEVKETVINDEELQEALDNVDEDFYKYLSEEGVINLTSISQAVMHINNYNGFFFKV